MEMRRYSIEPRRKKNVKEFEFLSFARKYKKQLLDTVLDAVKTASKKAVQKVNEFIGNKIADAVTKSNNDKIVKQEPVEEIIIPSEKKRWNIKQIKTSIIIQMENYKIFKLLNDSSVSKFVTKKWVEANDLSSC